MIEDMEKFKKEMLDPFQDKAAYDRIAVQVRRWKKAVRKKSKASETQKKL